MHQRARIWRLPFLRCTGEASWPVHHPEGTDQTHAPRCGSLSWSCGRGSPCFLPRAEGYPRICARLCTRGGAAPRTAACHRTGVRPHPASVAAECARRPAPPQEAASPAACADHLWPNRHPRRQPPRRTRGSAATGSGSGRAGAGPPATTVVPSGGKGADKVGALSIL